MKGVLSVDNLVTEHKSVEPPLPALSPSVSPPKYLSLLDSLDSERVRSKGTVGISLAPSLAQSLILLLILVVTLPNLWLSKIPVSVRTPEDTLVLLAERARTANHDGIVLLLPVESVLLVLVAWIVEAVECLDNTGVSPAVRGSVVPVGIKTRVVTSEALYLNRELAMGVDFVLVLTLVVAELLARVVDQVETLNHRIDPAILLKSSRVGGVCALDVRKVKLPLLGEDPSPGHLGHVLVGLRLLNPQSVQLEGIFEVSELLEPSINTLIVLVGLADRAPLGVDNNDSRESSVKEVQDIVSKGLLDLVLDLLPQTGILQRWEQNCDGKVGTENAHTEVESLWKLGVIPHLCHLSEKLLEDVGVVEIEGLHPIRTLDSVGASNSPHVTLALEHLDDVVGDDAKVAGTAA